MPASKSRIEHVVIIVKENHGFDNYFGSFPGANGLTLPRSPNPPPKDPDHRHAAWLTRKTTSTKAQFVEADIAAYFAYARQFALCDRYFTDVTGPSSPNHLMLIAGDSPIIANPPGHSLAKGKTLNLPSMPALLEASGRTWGNYGGYAFGYITGLAGKPNRTSPRFKTDAAAGQLPGVSWVYGGVDTSEHPPDPPTRSNPLVGNVTHGMQWTVDQVNALVKGGLWPKCAIFITWDDWGGWYDHVDPPEVETWPADGTPFRYGGRVGCLVLSPYARKGYISKTLHSHVSLLKFCQTLFQLPALNARVQKADDMSDCFDFNQTPLPPPTI